MTHEHDSYRRSSYCTSGGCVEVRVDGPRGRVYVRRTACNDQTFLVFTVDEWVAFVSGVKAGEFDVRG
jgi:hypothetical protein